MYFACSFQPQKLGHENLDVDGKTTKNQIRDHVKRLLLCQENRGRRLADLSRIEGRPGSGRERAVVPPLPIETCRMRRSEPGSDNV